MAEFKKCEVCCGSGCVEAEGVSGWEDCKECMGTGDVLTPENCKEGHGHCEDVEYKGETLVVCHDCKAVMRKCEVYSRVVGYLRPVAGWNEGKKQEFAERREYVIKR